MTVAIIARYTLRIMGPDVSLGPHVEKREKEIEEQVNNLNLSYIEDTINGQLPEGWYCKIME